MSLNNLVKRLQDIMRNDAGINGDAQRIEQMVWILFLKVYDAKEDIWSFTMRITPPSSGGSALAQLGRRPQGWQGTHRDALLNFVNGKLFPTLKAIEIDENTP